MRGSRGPQGCTDRGERRGPGVEEVACCPSDFRTPDPVGSMGADRQRRGGVETSAVWVFSQPGPPVFESSFPHTLTLVWPCRLSCLSLFFHLQSGDGNRARVLEP